MNPFDNQGFTAYGLGLMNGTPDFTPYGTQILTGTQGLTPYGVELTTGIPSYGGDLMQQQQLLQEQRLDRLARTLYPRPWER